MATTMGLALAAGPVSAQTSTDREWMSHMGWGWGGMLFGSLTMLIFLALIVALAVFVVRWLGGAPRHEPPEPRRTPLDILQERFAKGEIDRPEYEDRKRVLKGEG
jgi:putative membrane protein